GSIVIGTLDAVRLGYRTDRVGHRALQTTRRVTGPWAADECHLALIAAILTARLTHLGKTSLVGVPGLPADATAVTLRQLAGLPRPNEGTFAQGFGLSVSAAVNARVPHIVEPVEATLRTLGYRDPIQGCLHLAVDTLARPRPDAARDPAATPVPTTTQARRCTPDRTETPARVLDRIAGTTVTWDGAGQDPDTPRHRAEALLWTEQDLIAVAYRVNPFHVPSDGWAEVPLWITMAGRRGSEQRARHHRHPTGITDLGGAWLQQLHDAHRQVDALLWAITAGLPGPPPDQNSHASDPPEAGIEAWLARRTSEPITTIVDELRAHLTPEALRLVPEPALDTVEVAVSSDPRARSPLQLASQRTGLYLADQDLLIPDPPVGRYR
ncbi:MAG TPA: hypothetical protein VLQ92_12035, partial [Candidatus Limnocylindrales bacterium]|nr:hypothetical protein [Candidatus Limnocylindrales bacterium]